MAKRSEKFYQKPKFDMSKAGFVVMLGEDPEIKAEKEEIMERVFGKKADKKEDRDR